MCVDFSCFILVVLLFLVLSFIGFDVLLSLGVLLVLSSSLCCVVNLAYVYFTCTILYDCLRLGLYASFYFIF